MPSSAAAVVPANVVDATKELKEGKEGKAKRKSRAGTVSKGKDGKAPARPEGNGETTRPDFDPGSFAEKWDIWHVNEKGGPYFMRDPYLREWMLLTEGQLERWLQGFGLSKGEKHDPIREVERLIMCCLLYTSPSPRDS